MKKEIEEELEIKRQDHELRKREVKLKEDQFKMEQKRYFLSPGSTAIIAALFGIFASAITASITGYQNVELERLKQEFQIIVSVSENRTQEEAAKNLLFFVDIGALRDKNGKIREYALKGEAPIISNDFKLPNEDAAKNAIGFDASLWQGGINWTEIKETTISFIVIKATQGDQYIDPQFHNYWESAEANEIIRGAYHEYDDCVSSETQAAHFASVVKIEKKDIAPILSVMEDPSCLGYSDPRYLRGILAWLELTEKQYSRTPIIYTRKSLWDKITVKDFSMYPLWAAAYGFRSSPVIPMSWSAWTFWEYTDQAILKGTNSGTDLMILFNGPFEELQAFIEKN